MKTLVALLLGFATIANAQTLVASSATNNTPTVPMTTTSVATLPEPEYTGSVYLLTTEGKLVLLESKRGEYAYKGRRAGLKYAGTNSETRVMVAEFVVRLEGNKDPRREVSLLSLEQGKGFRAAYWVPIKFGARISDLREATKEGNTEEGIKLQHAKYGTNSVKIVPEATLAAGEYALQIANGPAFLFGVDSK